MIPQSILHARVVVGAGGGPEKTILNSVRYLTDLGYSSTCLYMRHPRDVKFQELQDRADRLGVELVTINDFGPLDWRVASRVQRVCEKRQPWVWHGHEYKSNLIGLLNRRSIPMHLVTTVHGWVQRSWKTPLYYAIDRFCLRHYDQVLCVSRDLRERCLRLGVASERCRYVPNGIDTEIFSRKQVHSNLRLAFGVPPKRLIIGAVGRLSEEKGFGFLLDSVSSLVETGHEVELWIIGEGDQRTALENKISALGLDGRVRLLGQRADMVDLYAAMDLFALSSLREGFPNVLLEAMAMELPVVATSIAGVPDLIRNRSNGLLVEPSQAAALTEGLKTLIVDTARRQAMGAAARKTVESEYSFAVRMKRVHEIYESLLPV